MTISPLEKARDDLREYQVWIESEIDRTRAARAALRGEPNQVRSRRPRDSAGGRAVVALRSDPCAVWTAQQVTAHALTGGWLTDSCDPVNAMRAALARLVDEGTAVRVEVGRFRLNVDTPTSKTGE